MYSICVISRECLSNCHFRFTELFKTSGMAEKEEARGGHPAQGAVGPARVPLVDLSKEDSEDTFESANGECGSLFEVGC